MTQGLPRMMDSVSPKAMGTLSVRRAQAIELATVATLLCRSFYADRGYWAWVVPLLRLGIHQDLRTRFSDQPSQYACMVGTSTHPAGAIVGTAEVALRSLSPWQLSPTVAYISNLAVDIHYRRQGVGLQLLLACEHIVRAWGQDAIYLHVLENNDVAQQLYAKAGYQPHQAGGCNELLMLVGWPRRILMCKSLS